MIVIDALDECKDEEPASAILSVLGRLVGDIPMVKFFLTGRPEPRIQTGFRLPLLAKWTDVFILHNVQPSLVNEDIRLLFKHNLSELASRRGELGNWPTEHQLDLLCKRAAGLFVYAVATVKFLDHKRSTPPKRLNLLLELPESTAREGKTKFKPNTTLDSLYASILDEAFDEDDSEDDPKVRSVLGAVVLAANPLSPSAIASLLEFDTEDVFLLLTSVQSLLTLSEDLKHPVRPFHKSFPDFLTDSTWCINERFHVPTPTHQTELLICCLELMNRKLESNMCTLPDTILNSEAGDLTDRVECSIDDALQYACRSWYKHLVDAPSLVIHTPAITRAIHHFLEKKFLVWLEVLSILDTVRDAVRALDAVAKWLRQVCDFAVYRLTFIHFRLVPGLAYSFPC